jgi:hypothetical protein
MRLKTIRALCAILCEDHQRRLEHFPNMDLLDSPSCHIWIWDFLFCKNFTEAKVYRDQLNRAGRQAHQRPRVLDPDTQCSLKPEGQRKRKPACAIRAEQRTNITTSRIRSACTDLTIIKAMPHPPAHDSQKAIQRPISPARGVTRRLKPTRQRTRLRHARVITRLRPRMRK